jgi:hypothetical protein
MRPMTTQRLLRRLLLSLVLLVPGSEWGATGPYAAGDGTYDVAVQAPAACPLGGACEVTLRIEGRGPYLFNTEYPTKLVLKAPAGASVTPVIVNREAAFAYSETGAAWKFTITGTTPGRKSFTGEAKFAVSKGSDSCLPKSAKIAFAIDMQ